ncbi:purple acid phosphatase 15-like isoform X1 [Populus alba x Populus x berolinensis]|nr:purple acid phosphatase 15-like isoform X1 [Populus alba x Populus x berolinensis]
MVSVSVLLISFCVLSISLVGTDNIVVGIPTTLDGPFKPVTVPLDKTFRGHAVDLPDTDPRVQRVVQGFEPEQISVSLSTTHDSVWISWITGDFQIGESIKPLNPKTVASVVRYGRLRFPLIHKATGYSLVYNQLYPFVGLQNYTSGIIHHVRLTDSVAVHVGGKEETCKVTFTHLCNVWWHSEESHVHYGSGLSMNSDGNKKAQILIYFAPLPQCGIQLRLNFTFTCLSAGLKRNTLYHYQCGDPSIPAMSSTYYFKTMPASGPKSYPSRIAIVGDLGLTYNTTSTVDHMIGNNPDLILLVGDVCYANLYLTNGTGADCYSCSFSQTPIHETYQPRWDYWGRYMQPVTSKIPIMVVEGNHEIEKQVENQTFVAYSSRFALPSKESGSYSAFYYSFNAGGIHFIMLGGYIAYKKSAHQYKWLEKDLAKVDRKVTPWLVATWHPPWYSTYKAHYREAECMRTAMEDLLYQYGVDIIFNGHVHAYERSNRVYNYTLDPCGPVHITVGDGGNREKMAIAHADEPGNCPDPSTTPDEYMGGFCAFNFTSGPAAGKFCWDRQPDYSAYRETSFGHGIFEMTALIKVAQECQNGGDIHFQVKNETHALWTWHRNQDMYNSPGDQIYIVRQPERCPTEPKVTKLWRIWKTKLITEYLAKSRLLFYM